MELAAVSWKLRIEELGSVLAARQKELSLQEHKRQQLHEELEKQHAQEARLELRLLELRQQQATLELETAQAKASAQEIELQDNESTRARLQSRLQELQSNRRNMEQAVMKEQARMEHFGRLMTDHSAALDATPAELQAQLAKAEAAAQEEAARQAPPQTYDQIAGLQADIAKLRSQQQTDSEALALMRAQNEDLRQKVADANRAKSRAQQERVKVAEQHLSDLYTQQQCSEKRLYELKRQEAAARDRIRELDRQTASAKQAIIHASL